MLLYSDDLDLELKSPARGMSKTNKSINKLPGLSLFNNLLGLKSRKRAGKAKATSQAERTAMDADGLHQRSITCEVRRPSKGRIEFSVFETEHEDMDDNNQTEGPKSSVSQRARKHRRVRERSSVETDEAEDGEVPRESKKASSKLLDHAARFQPLVIISPDVNMLFNSKDRHQACPTPGKSPAISREPRRLIEPLPKAPSRYFSDTHFCYGCGVERSARYRSLHKICNEKEAKPNLCLVCRLSLKDASSVGRASRAERKRAHLAEFHWCSNCGILRSAKYHNEYPLGAKLSVSGVCHKCAERTRIIKPNYTVEAESDEDTSNAETYGEDTSDSVASGTAYYSFVEPRHIKAPNVPVSRKNGNPSKQRRKSNRPLHRNKTICDASISSQDSRGVRFSSPEVSGETTAPDYDRTPVQVPIQSQQKQPRQAVQCAATLHPRRPMSNSNHPVNSSADRGFRNHPNPPGLHSGHESNQQPRRCPRNHTGEPSKSTSSDTNGPGGYSGSNTGPYHRGSVYMASQKPDSHCSVGSHESEQKARPFSSEVASNTEPTGSYGEEIMSGSSQNREHFHQTRFQKSEPAVPFCEEHGDDHYFGPIPSLYQPGSAYASIPDPRQCSCCSGYTTARARSCSAAPCSRCSEQSGGEQPAPGPSPTRRHSDPLSQQKQHQRNQPRPMGQFDTYYRGPNEKQARSSSPLSGCTQPDSCSQTTPQASNMPEQQGSNDFDSDSGYGGSPEEYREEMYNIFSSDPRRRADCEARLFSAAQAHHYSGSTAFCESPLDDCRGGKSSYGSNDNTRATKNDVTNKCESISTIQPELDAWPPNFSLPISPKRPPRTGTTTPTAEI